MICNQTQNYSECRKTEREREEKIRRGEKEREDIERESKK